MSWFYFILYTTDTENPSITCPQNHTLATDDGINTATGLWIPTASENSGQDPSVVCQPSSGSSLPVGATLVTCIATDAANNADTCRFEVVVVGKILHLIF